MKDKVKKLLKIRELSSLSFLIVLFLVVGLINKDFFKLSNMLNTIDGSAMYILLAVGISFVLLTGEIDNSIGSTLGLTAAYIATCVRDGVSLWIAIPTTLLIGMAIGLFNGIGVSKFKVPSIIMTLGTMGITRGFIYIYTDGKWVENLPDYFKQMSQVKLFGFINLFLLLTIIVVILIHSFLTKAKKGRYFAAVGDNVGGANLIGIPVARMQITAFVLSGFFASLAGILFVSRVGFVAPTAGTGYEMTAIAACVLGGVSLSGGVGSVIGASIGAIIMSSIPRILVFMKFSSDYDKTITGILLITIVVADSLMQRRAKEKARRARLSARSTCEEVMQ